MDPTRGKSNKADDLGVKESFLIDKVKKERKPLRKKLLQFEVIKKWKKVKLRYKLNLPE